MPFVLSPVFALKEVISAYFLNEDDFLEKLAKLDVHKLLMRRKKNIFIFTSLFVGFFSQTRRITWK